jgi:MFS family permease
VSLKDVFKFKLPYWLLTGSCVVTYMSIFPYLQIVSDLIQKKYGLDSTDAGRLFGVPYLISAVASPLLGALIDKIGKRALMVTISSLMLIIAFGISLSLPDTPGSYLELVPLVIVGVAYSIYCAAIWGSIPYTVGEQSVGTAFGMTTAIQNIGLMIGPTIVGFIKSNSNKMFGYYWVLWFFIGINVIGFVQNAYLYYIDIKYHDGILNKVDKGEQLADLMTSPP